MVVQQSHSARTWRHRRWVIPTVAAVVLAVLMGAGLLRSNEPQTVSQVRAEIYGIILHQRGDGWMDHGGIIGPWHVAAVSLDHDTGELRDFRLLSRLINLGAARAKLTIDARRDTFSFELREVVIMRVPDTRDATADQSHLVPLDSFILGPAKYHRRIVPD
jgi:hypothetical protein